MDKDLQTSPLPFPQPPENLKAANGSAHPHHNGLNGSQERNGQVSSNGMSTEELIKNFQPPEVPVIFVLGGPGSGKITHCEQITREKTSFVHISMADIMTTMLKGTDLKDSHVIPTRQMTATLLASIKSKPKAEGFVISGYPRNMRDTSEYLELVGRVDGVILLNWHLNTLERQIEYGAQLGEVELAAAKVELGNFKKHVIPVAEFFDHKQMLHLVTGDRKPDLVYTDFAKVFQKIVESDNRINRKSLKSAGSYQEYKSQPQPTPAQSQEPPPTSTPALTTSHVVWVVGGPGSNKYIRVVEVMKSHPTWGVLHTGKLFWDYLEKVVKDDEDDENEDKQNNNNENIEIGRTLREMLKRGDFVPHTVVIDMLKAAIKKEGDKDGFIIVGFPRDIVQAQIFQQKFSVSPVALLLDCSELELGRNLGQRRGRVDDNKEAVKRRLQLYREATLPMLKSLDEEDRLRVVDGDKEPLKVIEELREALETEISSLTNSEDDDDVEGVELTDMMIDDLEKDVEEDETTEARKA